MEVFLGETQNRLAPVGFRFVHLLTPRDAASHSSPWISE